VLALPASHSSIHSRTSKAGSQEAPTFRFLSLGHGVTGSNQTGAAFPSRVTGRAKVSKGQECTMPPRAVVPVECARILPNYGFL
jgi:hypothetical protein